MANHYKVVVDANIARSSGTTVHPVSRACREALDEIKSNNHSFILCETLLQEWKTHQSNYSAKWLASMFARRQVELIAHKNESKLRITSSKASDHFKNAALKDSHLIDAAEKSGKFITSSDDRAREAFAAISELQTTTKSIIWLNPVAESGVLIDILRKNKKPKKENRISN